MVVRLGLSELLHVLHNLSRADQRIIHSGYTQNVWVVVASKVCQRTVALDVLQHLRVARVAPLLILVGREGQRVIADSPQHVHEWHLEYSCFAQARSHVQDSACKQASC
jgi:3-deoxy-D-manno-octulosonic-acid transferase